MNQEPKNINLHPEHPPVLTGRESRQGTLYERRSGRRWLFLALFMIMLTAVAAVIYFGGGGQMPEGVKHATQGEPANVPGDPPR